MANVVDYATKIIIEDDLKKELSPKSFELLTNGERYPFHAWCWDKKKRCVCDDYNDPTTNVGNLNTKLREILSVESVEYNEFEKTPQPVTELITMLEELWASSHKELYFVKANYDSYGSCLQRAFIKHKSNPKRFRLRVGTMLWNFYDGTPAYNPEDDDARDKELGLKLLNRLRVRQRSKDKTKHVTKQEFDGLCDWLGCPETTREGVFHGHTNIELEILSGRRTQTKQIYKTIKSLKSFASR